jgi:flavorubredoxin
MSKFNISDEIVYIGADDRNLDLFESQYLVPQGVSYNSYVIIDEKIAVFDTVDKRATKEWFDHLEEALCGQVPDYLVILHLEPDHSANIQKFLSKYPETKLVVNAISYKMLPQFFERTFAPEDCVLVKEGDTLSLGKHVLQFIMAPMVHWPEVMVAYEQTEKLLFSADAFGSFGVLDGDILMNDRWEMWTDEARRYYINIVGKYGMQVQNLIKKLSCLDVSMICPLHGKMLNQNVCYYIDKYNTWSSYQPEERGTVIAYASIHGNTGIAARRFAEILKAAGEKKVEVFELNRADMAQVMAKAYQYDKLVLAGVTYDAGLLPCMEDFLYHLKAKNFRSRKVGIIENGSWGIVSGKLMKDHLEAMKDITICEKVVTIKSTLKAENEEDMKALAEQLISE